MINLQYSADVLGKLQEYLSQFKVEKKSTRISELMTTSSRPNYPLLDSPVHEGSTSQIEITVPEQAAAELN